MAHVSDIKLIRTDTTLDLSQKAEKGMLILPLGWLFNSPTYHPSFSLNLDVGLSLSLD
ncbi:hypothetical protein ACSBR2_006790 [Camellia fascicularis]